MESLKIYNKKDLAVNLNKAYVEANKDPEFKRLGQKLKATEKELKKHTSKLQESVKEIRNCSQCKGLFECANKVNGHIFYPNIYYEKLEFNYFSCKYQKANDKKIHEKETDEKLLTNARMKNIDILDKNRMGVIKWLKDFYDKYEIGDPLKGLYLHGSFGSGKTYLISALFNELNINKKATIKIVYFPEILRTLKDDWDYFALKMNNLQSVDLLLIDDIGAEKVTDWGRDEILGTILQFRMNNKLPTFFTSNLSLKDLEKHLALSNNNVDNIKARRIIERIKQLSEELELISDNRRN